MTEGEVQRYLTHGAYLSEVGSLCVCSCSAELIKEVLNQQMWAQIILF